MRIVAGFYLLNIIGVLGLNLRFEFDLYLNLNLLRGLGSGILLNLIPKPQVPNWVWTRFGRFRNWTMASLPAGGWFDDGDDGNDGADGVIVN